ncbi:MAG TPA: carboxypeptidase regulatory-like domain-containing protein [Pyrinomonadaceae bacterium]|nr:carboxypeptidase regulatory-like domain-containing protein [Pyrinomonadaceae bacterium]
MKPSPLTTPASLQITFILVLAFLSGTPTASAQDLDSANINGRIVDQNGAVIAEASITAILKRTGAIRKVTLGVDGRFSIRQLEPGTYELQIAAEGFASNHKSDLALIAGETAFIEVTLFPQGLTVEPVAVNANDEAAIDTTRTVVGGTLTTQEIEALPISSRSALDLLFALPGITEEPLSTRDLAEDREINPAGSPEEAGIFAVAGGPAYSNNLTIDGLDNNDDRAARERFQPSLEAIEEVQVITNQFSAEYGRASGGRINIKTRGGAQTLHGRVFTFFKDEALNANTFRNNSLGLKRLPLQEHNPGFTLGGPLLFRGSQRNRTFFFTSYELTNVLDSALIDTLVPVQQNPRFPLPGPTTFAGLRIEDAGSSSASAEVAPFVSGISTPLRNQNLTTRIDHRFSQTHNGTFLYQLGRLKNLRQFGGGNRLAEALQAKTRNSDALSYADSYVFSASTVNQTRLQWARLMPAVRADGGDSPVVLITLNDPLPAHDAARHTGTLVASSTTGSTDRSEVRFQIQEVLTHLKGAHTIKTGFDLQVIRSTFIDLADASGTFSFASAGDFLANTPSRFRQNFLSESTQRNKYLGFFIHDEWRVGANITFSFGLRYERESIVADRNNWAPRLSIAYDPLGSGRTVLRAGAGVFYNRALLRTIDDFTLGARQKFFDTNSLRDTLNGRLLSTAQRREFIAANLSFPRTLTADSPLVTQYGVLNTGFSRQLDPALRIPESYQANVGMERDLRHGLTFEANYTINRGVHLWRELNINAPRLPTGFRDFSQFLASRDFANFRAGPTGLRPLYNAATAGELIRFVFSSSDPANPNAIGQMFEFGVPVSLINLNSVSSSTAIEVALEALQGLRPDPSRTEVEQLVSAGNSFYRGLTFEIRRRFNASKNFSFAFRAAYTLSHLIDDGVVNTSDALTPGDFRHERARSLLDRRHRFVVSGTFTLPRQLGALRLAPIFRATSGAPFNISSGGVDRNLDDVSNDRPNFTGDTGTLSWRGPGTVLDTSILNHFSAPTIGQAGTLPRNAGHGPGFILFDLSVTREFRINDWIRLRPVIELDNVLNQTVFSFGAEFINFNALAPNASSAQRQAFLDSFLLTTRTLRQRQIRLGIRFDF